MLDYPNANIFTQSFPQWLCWSVHFADHPLSLSVLILYGQMSSPIVTPRYYVALRQMSGNYLIRANGERSHCHKEHFSSVFSCLQGSLHGHWAEHPQAGRLLRSSHLYMITVRQTGIKCISVAAALRAEQGP